MAKTLVKAFVGMLLLATYPQHSIFLSFPACVFFLSTTAIQATTWTLAHGCMCESLLPLRQALGEEPVFSLAWFHL